MVHFCTEKKTFVFGKKKEKLLKKKKTVSPPPQLGNRPSEGLFLSEAPPPDPVKEVKPQRERLPRQPIERLLRPEGAWLQFSGGEKGLNIAFFFLKGLIGRCGTCSLCPAPDCCFFFCLCFNPAFVYKCPEEWTPLLTMEQWAGPPPEATDRTCPPEGGASGESIFYWASGAICLNFDVETRRRPKRKDPLYGHIGSGPRGRVCPSLATLVCPTGSRGAQTNVKM
uniref:Uncharacterized protein n=1 Tax=Xenopus tropicalis TaxID=8364 RepID=A0A1B8XYK5_XENTR